MSRTEHEKRRQGNHNVWPRRRTLYRWPSANQSLGLLPVAEQLDGMPRKDYRARSTSSGLQSDPDGLLDRRIRRILAVEQKRLILSKWRPCEKARARAAIRVSCMPQERMAKGDGACRTWRQYL